VTRKGQFKHLERKIPRPQEMEQIWEQEQDARLAIDHGTHGESMEKLRDLQKRMKLAGLPKEEKRRLAKAISYHNQRKRAKKDTTHSKKRLKAAMRAGVRKLDEKQVRHKIIRRPQLLEAFEERGLAEKQFKPKKK
jgi:hypothetical protein